MASVVYNIFKQKNAQGLVDLDGDDIRLILCMTNTTADTEIDVDTVSALTTLDESDDSGYPVGFANRIALDGEAVNVDDTNDRAEFDATDVSITGLSGNATRDYQGVLIYKHDTSDAVSIPIAFIEFSSNQPKEATQLDITWGSEGILHLT